MVENVKYIAPFINQEFVVSSPWWVVRDGVLHRGLDIYSAGSGTAPVYSILTGIVHSKGYTEKAGNWIIIKDTNTGYATRYLHLAYLPLTPVGARINAGDLVADEGATGEVTGSHLHLEMQNIDRFGNIWKFSNNKSDYIDPTQFMGMRNVKGTHWIYSGTPHPSPTPSSRKKTKFKWVLYANKLRKR